VAVLYQGALVELAGTADFFANPQHRHSKELVAAARAHPTACAAPVACNDLAACAHRGSGRLGTTRLLELVTSPDS
jgi:ABC-type dipeptide/oligopeptide/nickel transport system ATPase component